MKSLSISHTTLDKDDTSFHLPAIDGSKTAHFTAKSQSKPTHTISMSSVSSENAKSTAVAMEVRLKEVFQQFPKTPAATRAVISFQIFDEVLENLRSSGSIYSPVLQRIREELYVSVFSQDLTSSETKPLHIDRIPYFVHIDRMLLFRQNDLTSLQDTIHDLEQKVKLREKDLNVLLKKNLMLKQVITKMEGTVEQTKGETEKMEQRMRAKEDEVNTIKHETNMEIQFLNDKIDLLQKNLDSATSMVEKLSNVKSKDSETAQSSETPIDPEMAKKHITLNVQTFVKMNLAELRNIEEQMKDILVAQLEDFESALTQLKKKKEILVDATQGPARHSNQMKFNAEVYEVTNSFQSRIRMFREEKALLDSHKRTMHEMVKRLRAHKHSHAIKRIADSVYRKHAVCLYYSTNNEKTYQQFTELPKCSKCGDMTLLCSHQLTQSIVLPLITTKGFRNQPWTHIRLESPALKQAVTSGQIKLFHQKSYHEAALIADGDLDENDSDEDYDELTEDLNVKLPRTMRIIWRDYYRKRKGTKPRIQRVLPLEKLLWTIKEVYDIRYRLEELFYEGFGADTLRQIAAGQKMRIVDDGFGDVTIVPDGVDPGVKSKSRPPALATMLSQSDLEFLKDLMGLKLSEKFSDYFYDFLEYRYRYKDIAMIVAHDIFSSMQEHASDNRKTIAMFVNHMSGDDDVYWKYVYLARELFTGPEKFSIEKYRTNIQLIYPYRQQKDFYEQLELEEVAFSKNKLTFETCIERLRHVILNRSEQNYRAFLHNFKKIEANAKGFCTKKEFIELMNTMYPPAPTFLKSVRYDLANIHFPHDKVPLNRLAMEASYCMLWCVKTWGGFEKVPPLEIHGDEYTEPNSIDAMVALMKEHDQEPKRFTSLENVYDDDLVDKSDVAAPRKRRGTMKKKVSPSASSVMDWNPYVNRTNEDLEMDEDNDLGVAVELKNRRAIEKDKILELHKSRSRQMSMDSANAAAIEAKILETSKMISTENEVFIRDMHNTQMALQDLPKVSLVSSVEEAPTTQGRGGATLSFEVTQEKFHKT